MFHYYIPFLFRQNFIVSTFSDWTMAREERKPEKLKYIRKYKKKKLQVKYGGFSKRIQMTTWFTGTRTSSMTELIETSGSCRALGILIHQKKKGIELTNNKMHIMRPGDQLLQNLFISHRRQKKMLISIPHDRRIYFIISWKLRVNTSHKLINPKM